MLHSILILYTEWWLLFLAQVLYVESYTDITETNMKTIFTYIHYMYYIY